MLHTAPVQPGFVESATVFAQQASAAGVTVQVKTEQVSNYFNPSLSYLKESFAQDIWATAALNGYYSQALLSSSPINETHWKNAAFDRLFFRAQAATDPNTAQALWSQLQQIQWAQGGNDHLEPLSIDRRRVEQGARIWRTRLGLAERYGRPARLELGSCVIAESEDSAFW